MYRIKENKRTVHQIDCNELTSEMKNNENYIFNQNRRNNYME
jgi:hypothetical protein